VDTHLKPQTYDPLGESGVGSQPLILQFYHVIFCCLLAVGCACPSPPCPPPFSPGRCRAPPLHISSYGSLTWLYYSIAWLFVCCLTQMDNRWKHNLLYSVVHCELANLPINAIIPLYGWSMKLPPPDSTHKISSINLTDCLLSITAILHSFANLTLVHYHLHCSSSFPSLSCQLYEHYCSNGIIFIPLSLTQSYLCSTKFYHKLT
jgi:hypothetical protein